MRTFHTGGVAGKYLTGVAEVKKKKQESLRDLHEDIRRGLVSIEDGVEGMERERAGRSRLFSRCSKTRLGSAEGRANSSRPDGPRVRRLSPRSRGHVVDIETRGLKRVIIHTEMPTYDTSAIAGEILVDEVINPKNGER